MNDYTDDEIREQAAKNLETYCAVDVVELGDGATVERSEDFAYVMAWIRVQGEDSEPAEVRACRD